MRKGREVRVIHGGIVYQRSRRSCPSQRERIELELDSMSRNSRPMPILGLTMRTMARASTVSSLRFKVTRMRDLTGSGLLVQTKQPPKEISEVIPSERTPDSRSRTSASAAKG